MPTNSAFRSRLLAAAGLASLLASALIQAAEPPQIEVHRDANCGCCKLWVTHLQDNGFTVVDHVETDMSAVKQRLGVPPRLASCHTAVIDGKFVEGHVPAAQVHELLRRPELIGLAVPGMPLGSPGMEAGERLQPYQVIGLDAAGAEQVVAEYPAGR